MANCRLMDETAHEGSVPYAASDAVPSASAGDAASDAAGAERRHGERRQSERRDTGSDGAAEGARADVAAGVARRWAAAWSGRDLGGLFTLMAAGIAIESNLDPDGDFVEVMCDLAAAVDRVDVVS